MNKKELNSIVEEFTKVYWVKPVDTIWNSVNCWYVKNLLGNIKGKQILDLGSGDGLTAAVMFGGKIHPEYDRFRSAQAVFTRINPDKKGNITYSGNLKNIIQENNYTSLKEMGALMKIIKEKYLLVDKPSRKTTILEIGFDHKDELLAKSFNENFKSPVSKALSICKSLIMLLSSSLATIGVILRLPSGARTFVYCATISCLSLS